MAEIVVFREIQSIFAPEKFRRCDQVFYEPYRSKILSATTTGKTKVNPRMVIRIMAKIYKSYIESCPHNFELFAAGYFIQRILKDSSPRELLPIWEHYSNGNSENK